MMKHVLVMSGLLVSGSALATPPNEDGDHKIKICHATASGTNPYNIIEVDVAAWSANPGVDDSGRPLKQSNHWRHQAEFGGKGDFWLEDETMSCTEFAQWITSSTQPADYLAQGRSILVGCNSAEAPNGDRIPLMTDFVDSNDGHIISIPCPDWHGYVMAPSNKVVTTARVVQYIVTNTAGAMPADFYFHSEYNPTPGTASTLTLDTSGGNFALICPASGTIDVRRFRFNLFGALVQSIVEKTCTPGAPVMKNDLFVYGSQFAPVALCPDEGAVSVCFTGNSGSAGVPTGLTSTHTCFDTYSCFAGDVDFSNLQVLNSGFFEFFVAYLP